MMFNLEQLGNSHTRRTIPELYTAIVLRNVSGQKIEVRTERGGGRASEFIHMEANVFKMLGDSPKGPIWSS